MVKIVAEVGQETGCCKVSSVSWFNQSGAGMKFFKIAAFIIAAMVLLAIAEDKTVFAAAAVSVFILLVIIRIVRKRRRIQ